MDFHRLQDWLIHCADPMGPSSNPPKSPLTFGQLRRVFVLAEKHGVLGLMLQNIGPPVDSASGTVHDDARSRHHAAIGCSLMLRQLANSVIDGANAAGVRAIVIKGPIFAGHLYPDKSLRRYTDIDFLAEGSGLTWVRDALVARGFYRAANSDTSGYEQRWRHRDQPRLAVEIQSDLIHAPSLRATMSLKFSDLVEGRSYGDAETPAALLAVAVTHGAAHQFDRLIHVVDILQAARRLSEVHDEENFERIVVRTGTRFSAVVGLELAARMFGDRRCLEVAGALGPVHHSRAAARAINASVVVSTMDERRPLYSWRRSIFRELLKASPEGRNTSISASSVGLPKN